MCLAKMAPTCLEYVQNAYIGKWDFTSPDYQGISYDSGLNGMDFNLINDQTLYDPIYVHNQGLYFDGTSHIRTTNTWTQTLEESITYEGWIRPTGTPKGDLIAFEEAPNLNSFSISINGANIEVDIGGTIGTVPITVPTVGDWTYVGVSIQKIENNRVNVCAVMGTNAEVCVIVNAEINLPAVGHTFQVGNNFQGMIKDFSVLDWPKRGYEFSSMVQTSGCTAFNGAACTMCPSTTGQCISTCNKNEYGSTCTTCLSPNCASCYGDTYAQCYQCLPGYDFTYMGQS